MINERGAP